MTPPKLDHVAVRVSDLDTAVVFYTEKLGLPLKFREVDAAHGEAFAFLTLEGGDIELLQRLYDSSNADGPANPVPVEPFCPHLAIATDDMDETMAMLADRGVPILKGPLEIPGKVRWLYVRDPDNNVIEFVQWL